jgi:hypothetical protein
MRSGNTVLNLAVINMDFQKLLRKSLVSALQAKAVKFQNRLSEGCGTKSPQNSMKGLKKKDVRTA